MKNPPRNKTSTISSVYTRYKMSIRAAFYWCIYARIAGYVIIKIFSTYRRMYQQNSEKNYFVYGKSSSTLAKKKSSCHRVLRYTVNIFFAFPVAVRTDASKLIEIELVCCLISPSHPFCAATV